MFINEDYILAAAEQFGCVMKYLWRAYCCNTDCRYPMCDSSIWSYCQDIGDMPVHDVDDGDTSRGPPWRRPVVGMVVVVFASWPACQCCQWSSGSTGVQLTQLTLHCQYINWPTQQQLCVFYKFYNSVNN